MPATVAGEALYGHKVELEYLSRRADKRAVAPTMKKLATMCVPLALIAGVAGCGTSSGPPYHYSAQQKAAAVEKCEQAAKGAEEHLEKKGTPTSIGEEAPQACACSVLHQETIIAPGKEMTESAANKVDAGCFHPHKTATTNPNETTPQHTPEEEEGHNKGLEIQRRYEENEAIGRKNVEEAEDSSEGKYTRHIKEKVCYESGESSEECADKY